MIGVLILIQVLLVASGVYQLCKVYFKIPSRETSKVVLEYVSKAEKKTMDMYLMDIAVLVSHYVQLLPFKKERLKEQLTAAGMDVTPETYVAFAYVKAVCYMAVGMVFLMIPKLGMIPCIFFFLIGINSYFVESSRVEVLLRNRKGNIEKELPRLANTIRQELKFTRDIVKILEDYGRNAGKVMQEEINITVADMKSGNYEMALNRFETRISSITLSQIVRGLLGVIRGDDGIFYFEMLSHDLRKMETQQLRMEAIKQPEKIGKYSMYLFLCLLLIIFTMMGIVLMGQIKSVL